MDPIRAVETSAAPPPRGHYEQGLSHGSLVWISTQLPLGGAVGPEDTAADQALQVLTNLEAIARAAGTSFASALRVTIYLTDMADWPEVDRAFADAFAAHRPTRGVLGVAALHLGYRVAMDAVLAGESEW